MASNFPISLDDLANPSGSAPLNSPDHATQHGLLNDGLEALEAKVGVDSSAVTTSHDYKIRTNLTTATTYTDTAISTLLATADSLSVALAASASTYRTSLGLGAAALLGASQIIRFVFDGGGSALTTGAKKVYVTVPWNATITSWNILPDQSGSIVFDIWKDTYANFPPTVADTITASAKPTLTATTKATSSTLTGWTTTITAGQVLEVNIDSITTCTKVVLELLVTRTS